MSTSAAMMVFMGLIDEGKEFQHSAGRPVILYSYPKDDTLGCAKGACDFRDSLPKFKKSKAGIRRQQEVRRQVSSSTFPLLAANHEVAEKYGVWQQKSLYGRKFMGIVRTTYLIGADGKVAKRCDDVKVDGHAVDLLADVGELA